MRILIMCIFYAVFGMCYECVYTCVHVHAYDVHTTFYVCRTCSFATVVAPARVCVAHVRWSAVRRRGAEVRGNAALSPTCRGGYGKVSVYL